MNILSLGMCIFPDNGWKVHGKILLPPNAYINNWYWLEHITKIFPEKGKKIQNFIEKSELKKQEILIQIAVFKWCNFLNKKYLK